MEHLKLLHILYGERPRMDEGVISLEAFKERIERLPFSISKAARPHRMPFGARRLLEL
jgi:hypothetical protein